MASIHKSTQPKSYFVNGNVESDVVAALLLFNGNVSSCIEPLPKNIRSLHKECRSYNRAIVPDRPMRQTGDSGSPSNRQNAAFLLARLGGQRIISSGFRSR